MSQNVFGEDIIIIEISW